MDGNGRWATQRNLPRFAGHKEGLKVAQKIIKQSAKLGIQTLSLFAFSSENWSRPKKEVDYLMSLFVESLKKEVFKLHENKLCLKFIGDRTNFSKDMIKLISKAEDLTKNNQGMCLVIALNYGGKWDILHATQTIAHKVEQGLLKSSEINEELFSQHLSIADLAYPDLFIRTSGEQRLSNFFLWQLAYAEIYFCQDYWPNFNEKKYQEALDWYTSRERRYGLTSEQLVGENDA